MMNLDKIDTIVFDADDTLWDNQHHFENAERKFCEILNPYGSADEISRELFNTEKDNMEILGYGVQAFTISMIETALRVSKENIGASDLKKIVEIGKSLLYNPATPLPGVEKVLRELASKHKYRLIVMTKGNTLDQNNKLTRSGLRKYFRQTIIVDDKTEKEYQSMCDSLAIRPDRFVMIGNSLKSDIIPAINIGGYGIHIPYEVTWLHEHTEDVEHERIIKVDNILKILPVFNI